MEFLKETRFPHKAQEYLITSFLISVNGFLCSYSECVCLIQLPPLTFSSYISFTCIFGNINKNFKFIEKLIKINKYKIALFESNSYVMK